MDAIVRPSDLQRVSEASLRAWLADRMDAAIREGIEVRFVLLEPGDDVVTECWLACWGTRPGPAATLDVLLAVAEYVREHATFFEAVVLPNDEAATVLVFPSAIAQGAWLAALRRASGTLEPTPV